MPLPSFVSPVSESARYVGKKQQDPQYDRWAKGQLVWLRQHGPVYRPAKVKRAFDRGSRSGLGVVMYKEQGKIKEVEVDEATSLAIEPMGTSNLAVVPHFDPDALIDISEPALFHNIRVRMQLGYSFQSVCYNVLLFLNSDFETDVLSLSTLADFGDTMGGNKAAALKADPQVRSQHCHSAFEISLCFFPSSLSISSPTRPSSFGFIPNVD